MKLSFHTKLLSLILINIAILVYAVIVDFSWDKFLVGFVIAKIFAILGSESALHRLWAHRSYRIARWKEYILHIFAIPLLHGSSITYSGIHRQHHAYSDTPKDPHMGSSPWYKVLFFKMPNGFQIESKFVADLLKQPIHKWVHKYYFKINLSILVLCLIILGTVWTGFTLSFMIAWNFIGAGLTNILGHIPKYGKQPYNNGDNSTNNLFVQSYSWNEGLHNNHHKRPNNWDFRMKSGEIDVPAIVIKYFLKEK